VRGEKDKILAIYWPSVTLELGQSPLVKILIAGKRGYTDITKFCRHFYYLKLRGGLLLKTLPHWFLLVGKLTQYQLAFR